MVGKPGMLTGHSLEGVLDGSSNACPGTLGVASRRAQAAAEPCRATKLSDKEVAVALGLFDPGKVAGNARVLNILLDFGKPALVGRARLCIEYRQAWLLASGTTLGADEVKHMYLPVRIGEEALDVAQPDQIRNDDLGTGEPDDALDAVLTKERRTARRNWGMQIKLCDAGIGSESGESAAC